MKALVIIGHQNPGSFCHAIAKAAPADQRYLSLVNQFAVLMEHDLEEMQNLLAEKEAALEARTVSPDASEGEEK